MTDAPSLRAALDGCATVYHAAGIPEQWRKDVGEFARVNVEGTRNVVEAALAAGVERFVYTSTDDVLVQGPGAAFDESVVNPSPGQTPYQRSKQEADRIVTAALDRGLPAVFLHPAGLYGPAPFLVKGLNDLLLQLAKRKTPMPLPGGMGVAYSEDVADGHVRAAAQAAVGARYLLASRFSRSRTSHEWWPTLSPARRCRVWVMPLAIARAVSMAGEGVARVTGRPPMISRSVLLFLEQGFSPFGRARAGRAGVDPDAVRHGRRAYAGVLQQAGFGRDARDATIGANPRGVGSAPVTIVLVRHGETEWSAAGKHTSTTDVPLLESGRRDAERLRERLAGRELRARPHRPLHTRAGDRRAGRARGLAEVDEDLAEFDYGEYEGLTTLEIREARPGWSVWVDGAPGGETAEQVGARADRVIERALAAGGDVAVFAHGHLLRVLGARYLDLRRATAASSPSPRVR